MGFLLFAKAVGTAAGGEVRRPSEVNVPVRLNSDAQEAWIQPGDYIIADLNGVVRLPEELAERLLDAIPETAEADDKCAEGIRAGGTVEEVLGSSGVGNINRDSVISYSMKLNIRSKSNHS